MDIYATRERMRIENISFMQLPLRVAYYARVSTEFMEQLNSLENQVQYFTEYIGENPNWEFVDGYIDEGISGITAQKRERFIQMIEDAKQGKFDLIVTKEVSRFARNTLDSLRYTRELLNNGVAVFFQNDGLNTIEKDSELRLTIMSSVAQDESRKISERVKWGHRQYFNPRSRMGSDGVGAQVRRHRPISIHAPAWGATIEERWMNEQDRFQSTLPHGERRRPSRSST